MNRFSLVLAIIVVSACSKTESSPAADSLSTPAAAASGQVESVTACTIASKEEMSAAIGAEVTGTDEVNQNHCIYKTANALAYADVEIDRQNADAAWQGVNSGDSIIGAPQDSLAGIGEKAFYGPRDRLYFRKGNAFVAVEGGFDGEARARARKVAQLIASKL